MVEELKKVYLVPEVADMSHGGNLDMNFSTSRKPLSFGLMLYNLSRIIE